MGDLLVVLLLGSLMGLLVSFINPGAALVKADTRLAAAGRWAIAFSLIFVIGLLVDLDESGGLPDGLNVFFFALLFVVWPAFAAVGLLRRKDQGKPVSKARKKAATKEPPPLVTSRATPSQNLRFTYEDRFGNITDRELLWWIEDGDRIIGGDLTRGGEERTFIKDSIVEYHDGEPVFYESDRDLEPEPEPLPRKPKKTKPQPSGSRPFEICFTGFEKERKKHLEGLANGAGMKVRTKVTQKLDFLVCGEVNPGPVKVTQAEARGASILDEDGFFKLIQTGELD